jgi:hypothetical protein
VFDDGPGAQLCKKASAKKSQRGHAGYGEELLRRSKRLRTNKVVVPMKKTTTSLLQPVDQGITLQSTFAYAVQVMMGEAASSLTESWKNVNTKQATGKYI